MIRRGVVAGLLDRTCARHRLIDAVSPPHRDPLAAPSVIAFRHDQLTQAIVTRLVVFILAVIAQALEIQPRAARVVPVGRAARARPGGEPGEGWMLLQHYRALGGDRDPPQQSDELSNLRSNDL